MNDETFWTNQQILFHNDKVYGSDSNLDIKLSISTNNFNSFSIPKLNITIRSMSDNTRRQCNLTIQDSVDLLNSIKIITDDIDIAYANNHAISKRYNNNRDFIIQFKKSRTGDRCVIFRIFFNDSDFGRVIFPLLIFNTFVKLVKYFVDNYITIINQLNTFSILRQNYNLLNQINIGIKTLPSSISITSINQDPLNKQIPQEPYNENNNLIIDESTIINEFDEFIGGSEISKIEINREVKDEFNSHMNLVDKKVKTHFDSKFFTDFLKGDILVLEDILNGIYQNNNPCISFLELQNRKIPKISKNDLKVISYIPRVIFLTTLRKFVELNVIIPSSNPILKYKVDKDNVTKEEKDFALDLLIIQGYLKILRSKLESKNNNQIETKSVINLAFRNFTDIFIFSYLEIMDIDIVSKAILERFKFLKSINFFNNYDKLIKDYKLNEITESDISNYIKNIFDKVIGKDVFIEDIQNDLFNKGKLKLPFSNNYSIEQIINEIVPIEVFQNVNNKNSLKNKDDVLKKLNINISKEVSNLFFKSEDNKRLAKRLKEKPEKLNIQKIVEEYIDEVPEEWKKPLLKYLSTLENEKFDFSKFPVIEFGDNVVKSIYLWNPVEEESDLINYLNYRNKVEKSLMSKNDILNLIKETKETKESDESDESWDSISFE